MSEMTKAAKDVLAERARHITQEGWSHSHDDWHTDGEMGRAAACYAAGQPIFVLGVNHGPDDKPFPTFDHAWPWDDEWWKPRSRRRDLVRAGALILAEIERLDRAAADKKAAA